MAGQPYWTQDTGGFFVYHPQGERNPEYRELFARWHQFGVFNPIYRIHGTSIEREPYLFKTLAPEIYRVAARRRAAALPAACPTSTRLAWQSTANGYTMMRGLPMDFPDDPKVRKIDDAFMFGPAFLVHPVTRAMYHASAPPPATIPTEALRTPDGKPGLAVRVLRGREFRAIRRQRRRRARSTTPGPARRWPIRPPASQASTTSPARWEGTITAPEDGEYEIGVEDDDGVPPLARRQARSSTTGATAPSATGREGHAPQGPEGRR